LRRDPQCQAAHIEIVVDSGSNAIVPEAGQVHRVNLEQFGSDHRLCGASLQRIGRGERRSDN